MGLTEEYDILVCSGDLLWLRWTTSHLDAVFMCRGFLSFFSFLKDYEIMIQFSLSQFAFYAATHPQTLQVAWITSLIIIQGISHWHQHSNYLLLLFHVSNHAWHLQLHREYTEITASYQVWLIVVTYFLDTFQTYQIISIIGQIEVRQYLNGLYKIVRTLDEWHWLGDSVIPYWFLSTNPKEEGCN